VRTAFGGVPNGVATIAVSTPALEGFLVVRTALAHGSLRAGEREQLAIAVAERNGCTYCLSAHTAAAEGARVGAGDRAAARRFAASTDRAQAILTVAEAMLDTRGDLADEQLAAARSAGLTDAEVVEVAAQVALATFTNLVNRAARTELDVPRVEAGVPA
jgi:uncharacterized peroxidase-related enzyme